MCAQLSLTFQQISAFSHSQSLIACFQIFLWVENNLTFLAMLAFSVLAFLGSCLFVRGCYPVANESSKSKVLGCLSCCCGNRQFLIKHAATDWLVGTWFIYWANLIGVIGMFFFTLYYLAWGASHVANFANITTLIDLIIFLIGSAYFVAGAAK